MFVPWYVAAVFVIAFFLVASDSSGKKCDCKDDDYEFDYKYDD